jgi:hypothetical protein
VMLTTTNSGSSSSSSSLALSASAMVLSNKLVCDTEDPKPGPSNSAADFDLEVIICRYPYRQ